MPPPEPLRVRSLEEAEAHVQSWSVRIRSLERRTRTIEELADVMDTPMWRRALFVIDGWPLFRVVDRPQWRPWRRWFTS